MGIEVNTESDRALRYLDGTAIECPAGKLEGLSLVSKDDEALGLINGVLIDPQTRQVRYYVVELPFESIERQRFDARAVPRFSDDDLLTAMFSSRVA